MNLLTKVNLRRFCNAVVTEIQEWIPKFQIIRENDFQSLVTEIWARIYHIGLEHIISRDT